MVKIMTPNEFLDNINNKHPTLLSDVGFFITQASGYIDFLSRIAEYVGFKPSNYDGTVEEVQQELYEYIMNMTKDEVEWLKL